MTARGDNTLCIGAAHWDIIGRAVRPVRVGDDVPGRVDRRPGGVALNVALALAARGCGTSLCTVIGSDEGGDALRRFAVSAGVGCDHVYRVGGAATDIYMAIEDVSGNLIAAIADTALIETHSGMIVGHAQSAMQGENRIFMDANLPAAAISAIGACAAKAGVEITANPVSPAKARRLDPLFSDPHHLAIIANLPEASALTGQAHEDAATAAIALHRHGAHTALVTNGPDPAALATPQGTYVSMPRRLSAGISVTGAGDALLAAFLSVPDRDTDPQAALDFAVQAAAEHMKMST